METHVQTTSGQSQSRVTSTDVWSVCLIQCLGSSVSRAPTLGRNDSRFKTRHRQPSVWEAQLVQLGYGEGDGNWQQRWRAASSPCQASCNEIDFIVYAVTDSNHRDHLPSISCVLQVFLSCWHPRLNVDWETHHWPRGSGQGPLPHDPQGTAAPLLPTQE